EHPGSSPRAGGIDPQGGCKDPGARERPAGRGYALNHIRGQAGSMMRTDNGPEFTSRVFIAWAQQHGIDHPLIEPGGPTKETPTSRASAASSMTSASTSTGSLRWRRLAR